MPIRTEQTTESFCRWPDDRVEFDPAAVTLEWIKEDLGGQRRLLRVD